jgi:peptide deformylase
LLSTAAEQLDLSSNHDLEKITTDLHDNIGHLITTHDFRNGIGLSAPQLGYSKRIFALKMPGESVRVFANPIVHTASDNVDLQWEGCLSFFEVRAQVPRALEVTISYWDEYRTEHTEIFLQGHARLIQHEIDHLNGTLYTARLPADGALVPYQEYVKIPDTGWDYTTNDAAADP